MCDRESYAIQLTHIEHLLDRRQTTTSFYFSVNTAIVAVIGVLVKNAQLQMSWLFASILLLLIAGFIACWIWRSLLYQYEILLDWWYARLRELEAEMPDSPHLITREYQELYLDAKHKKSTERIGMTRRELALNYIFSGLYVAFALGIFVGLLR